MIRCELYELQVQINGVRPLSISRITQCSLKHKRDFFFLQEKKKGKLLDLIYYMRVYENQEMSITSYVLVLLFPLKEEGFVFHALNLIFSGNNVYTFNCVSEGTSLLK